MAKNNNLTDFLTNTAAAIRTVEGTTATINPQDFEARIKALKKAPTGNIQLTTNASTDVTNYATATVRSASTYTMTGSVVTDTVSLGTLSSGYYPVNAKVKGTISAGTAGWFSSSGAVQAGTATQVGKIAAGTITNNTSGGTSSGTVNFGNQIKIGAGYYPSDSYYTAQSPSGNIQLTQSSSTNVASYATATVKGGSATTPATTITANPSAPTWNSSTEKYDISVSATKSVTPSVSAGWVSSGTAGTITVSGASTLNESTFAVGTLPSGQTALLLDKNKTYKLTSGYYPNDRYYSTQGDPILSGDAAVGNVLTGKTFYSNSYSKQTGTMTNNGAVSQSLNTSTTSYTIPAGYHNGSGTVSITTETKTASGSGDITPSSGKVLSKVTVGAGSATPSATVSGSSSALSSTTAMNNQYFSVTPKATVGTAGWISSINNGTAVNYKVKDGSATTPATTITANPSAPTLNTSDNKYYVTVSKTQNVTPTVSAGWVGSGTAGTITVSGSTEVTKGTITNNTSGGTSSGTINFGKQLKVGAGWYPSDLYYTAQNPSGNIQLTTKSSTNVSSYATATVRSASGISVSEGTLGYIGSVTVSSTPEDVPVIHPWTGYAVTAPSVNVTVNVTTAGWYSGSGSQGYTASDVSVGYIRQYSASTSSSSSGASLSLTVTPGTANKYVNITTGYRPASYLTVSGDSNLIASNIKKNVNIFGVTGTYQGITDVINTVMESTYSRELVETHQNETLSGSASNALRLFWTASGVSSETGGITVSAAQIDLYGNYTSRSYYGGNHIGEDGNISVTLTNFTRNNVLVIINLTADEETSASWMAIGLSRTDSWDRTIAEDIILADNGQITIIAIIDGSGRVTSKTYNK